MRVRLKNMEDYIKVGVYQLTNLVNNKIYIGSTGDSFKTRWKTHQKKLKNNKHPNSHLQNAYNKYGDENFEFTILEVTDTKILALEKEQYFLDKYKSYDNQIGYNIEIKVDKSEISEETKLKISNTLKEKYASGELVCADNTKNIAGWNKGLKCPQIGETRRKISDSIEVYNSNLELIVIFRSCIDLCEWSENSDNIMPFLNISTKNKKRGLLRKDKIYLSIRTNKPYKGLYFKKCLPLSSEMGIAKWVNSKNAEMQILSQASSTLDEGATTTCAV